MPDVFQLTIMIHLDIFEDVFFCCDIQSYVILHVTAALNKVPRAFPELVKYRVRSVRGDNVSMNLNLKGHRR